ncbi:restriction endonuclease subunit S [Anaerococcus sp. NML200574]|uniref:restriction endonuclease subunit S n=1 Tax=Anaerococcus sp. NML200574 TaxID=2954486 RepID=UPI0022372B66|nr:restriction endonuclease subunit S [Anaerococcus sp. NML200574]MCW6678290.1 restriction endonuclease subunit S [Anaerococcus sp. NML200574]
MTLTRYKLGDLIEKYDKKCGEPNLTVHDVSGINRDKEFFEPSRQVGKNTSNYKNVPIGFFATNLMHVGRDVVLPVAYNHSSKNKIVSPAYTVFKVKDNVGLIDQFLFIYFNSKERDRYFWFSTDASIRDGLSWEDFCDIKIDLPPLDIQKKCVAIYKAMLENQAAYEKGLEDLKLACDASMDKLKENYKLIRINEVLKIVDIRNKNLDIKEISGLNIEKRFIKSNSNINENGLKNYKIVKQDELVFSGMQTGRDKCIRIALNTTNNNLIVSPAYNVFSINKNIINPKYLMLWFSRAEVDRYGWFISDSSIRSNLDLDRFYEIEIPIPPIEVQNSIADIYKVYTERKEINEKLKERLKNICPILIKGAVEEAKRKEA